MCGLAGILYFNKSQRKDPGLISSMCTAMAHRGPDADGFYQDEMVALGHRRLSIIDLSECANQPFTDNSGRYRLIFNGEIYNFQQVKDQVPDYAFRTNGDTEVILATFLKFGPKCLDLLKGMFVFVIWDTVKKELFLARDRMGVKPLYYYHNNEYFIFASEIRALLATGLVPRKANHSAIREFLHFQSIGYPHAIVDGIKQLEASNYLSVCDGQVHVKKYWDITRNEIDFDFSDANRVHSHIEDLMTQSVQRRLISDVPIGAFLSGGIDSSAVVGLMAKVSPAPVNTFTIGFSEKEFDESGYANIIATKFKTNHNRVLLEPTVFLDEVSNAMNAMDTPSGDGVNTYVVSKAIKNSGLTVALSGIGGDELFAGYPFFKQYIKLRKYYKAWKPSTLLRHAMAGIISLGDNNKAERISRIINASSCSIDCFYPEFRRIISRRLISRLTKWPADEHTGLEEQLNHMRSSFERFPDLSQVSIAEYMGYTQHTLLKDTDQMSMAVSLEVREPFFDHDLVSFVLAVPDQLKFPRYPKSLLVDSLNGLLPDKIVHRPKQGFLFPWNIWMKGPLKAFCEEHILRMSQREFIHAKELIDFWKKFLRGDASVRWTDIWLFVILEFWLEKNNIHN